MDEFCEAGNDPSIGSVAVMEELSRRTLLLTMET